MYYGREVAWQATFRKKLLECTYDGKYAGRCRRIDKMNRQLGSSDIRGKWFSGQTRIKVV